MVRADRAASIARPQILVADPLAALRDFSAWHRGRSEALVIGVTGSVGKTTTREMIHAALGSQHPGIRSRKNYNNEIGLPLSLLDIEPQHEFAVLEFGAGRIGDVAELAQLALPEVGVITAIGPAHLATFGSIEGVMQAKGELLEALPAGGFAVLPGDCPMIREVSHRSTCRVIFVGEGEDNHLRAGSVRSSQEGLTFRIERQTFHLPVLGRHHLASALIAVAIGREIGIAADQLADSLATFEPIPGRSQLRRIGPWTVIDDTYNASPTAFVAALDAINDIPISPMNRRVVIAGDMLELGSIAEEEHQRLGERIAASRVDRLLVTGEFADVVAAGAISAGLPAHRIAAAQDWDTLLFLLECWLEPGDVILVKGSRGMRMERIIDWLNEAASRWMTDQYRRSA